MKHKLTRENEGWRAFVRIEHEMNHRALHWLVVLLRNNGFNDVADKIEETAEVQNNEQP